MFEPIYGNITQRKLEINMRAQNKVDARVELKTPAKKILSVTAACFPAAAERTDTEVRVPGKVVTRVIFIDENDAYNSEEHTSQFTEKFALKTPTGIAGVVAHCHALETTIADQTPTSIDAVTVIDIALQIMTQTETRFITELKGDCESHREKMSVATFGRIVEDRFTVDDKFDLDKNCEGILGVDCTAALREINCSDNKIMLKGSVSVNVIGTKAVQDAPNIIYNNWHEFDFQKTIACNDIKIDDVVTGAVTVAGVSVKAENKTAPALSVDVEIAFVGNSITQVAVEFVADAICFDNHLNFVRGQVESSQALPQLNQVTEVEGNMTMPEGQPYIAKILSTGTPFINSINIVPADNKVTIEGVLTAPIVYECEEKQVHTYRAQVPFSTVVKIDGINATHNVAASVTPASCNIKARRGKELLVDARLSIGIAAQIASQAEIVSDVTLGEPKTRDDSAIMIYIAGDKESLWDVAKRVSCSQNEIVKQNPSAADGITAGDRIFIYRQQIINF